MSHYVCFVLTDQKPQNEQDAINIIKEPLEPFRERLEVYNPQSKWDYYSIGGLWNGYLTDYDPESDERNMETCPWCEGTGKREDMEIHNGCNGCAGKGSRLKWNGHVFQDSNIMSVNELPLDDSYKWNKYCPFAILDTEGEWHENKRNEELRDLLLKNKDKFLTVIDYHY